MAYRGQNLAVKLGHLLVIDTTFFDDLVQQVSKDVTLQQISGLLSRIDSTLKQYTTQQIVDVLNEIKDLIYKATDGLITHPFSIEVDGTVVPKTGTQDVVTPTTGKRLVIRGIYFSTTSDAGIVEVRFKNTRKIVFSHYIKYDNKYYIDWINLKGDINEPLEVYWDNVTTPSKIVLLVNYIEE